MGKHGNSLTASSDRGDASGRWRLVATNADSPWRWGLRWDTLAMAGDDSETVLAPTVQAAPAELAWSETDDDDETDDLDADWDERSYAWGTVKIFAVLMAVVIVGAIYIGVVWTTTHRGTDTAVPVSQTQAAPMPLGPDDRVVSSSPPAAAAPPAPVLSLDDQYLTALHRDGLISGTGTAGELGIGHAVCRALDRGESRDQIAAEIQQANPQLPSLATSEFIMNTAIRFYCPPPG